MSKFLEKAESLRNATDKHYNCAQSVLLSFASDIDLSDEQAFKISSNFGSGMKSGSVCGAVTGALMVLGFYGVEDPDTIRSFLNKIKTNHNSCLDCKDLLKQNADAGGDKKQHCDALVYECVKAVEEFINK